MPQELDIPKISAKERYTIMRTWSDDFNEMFDIAIDIYKRLFIEDPSVLAMFPSLRHSTTPLKDNPTFSGMAISLVKVVANTVKSLENLEQMIPTLDEIGIFHAQFIKRGMKMSHWDCMNRAIKFALFNHIRQSKDIKSILSREQQDLSYVAWSKVIDFITTRIKNKACKPIIAEVRVGGFHSAGQEMQKTVPDIEKLFKEREIAAKTGSTMSLVSTKNHVAKSCTML